jgi:hypothetical protein
VKFYKAIFKKIIGTHLPIIPTWQDKAGESFKTSLVNIGPITKRKKWTIDACGKQNSSCLELMGGRGGL